MSLKTFTLRRSAGVLALACGLLAPAALVAQSAYSSTTTAVALNLTPATPAASGQYGDPGDSAYRNGYGPRRAPRYTGGGWMDHVVLEAGGGGTAAAGSTQNYANPGWNVLLGGGLRFNGFLSLLAEWNFNRLGVPHSLAGAIAQTPDGNEHLWTVDLNPKLNLVHTRWGNGYAIGGGGFSRALTSFTVPVDFACYDYYFGGYPCSGNVTVAHTSSNQANWDIGLGGEWRLSQFGREKLFVEARYVKMFTPNNGLPPGPDAQLVPVTAGIRW